jgi:hypothetical protein
MVTPADMVIRVHALQRMAERQISLADVLAVVNTNDVIEEYPTDTPFSSVLGLGFVNGRPIHVVWALGPGEKRTIVTLYEPDPARWDKTFRVRRPKT